MTNLLANKERLRPKLLSGQPWLELTLSYKVKSSKRMLTSQSSKMLLSSSSRRRNNNNNSPFKDSSSIRRNRYHSIPSKCIPSTCIQLNKDLYLHRALRTSLHRCHYSHPTLWVATRSRSCLLLDHGSWKKATCLNLYTGSPLRARRFFHQANGSWKRVTWPNHSML